MTIISTSHSSDKSSKNGIINIDDNSPPITISDITDSNNIANLTTSNYASINCSDLTHANIVAQGGLGDDTVECGQVAVPADWSAINKDTIKLAVYRIPSTSPNPAPDPVVYLAGGPGSSGVREVRAFSTFPNLAYLRSRSDIIVIDQRGTGFSQPDLFCPEVIKATAESGDMLAGSRACHDRLVGTGVRFADYNSAYNAQDINAVREALGYSEWNLYGVSYGTRLALTVMRDQPDGVRSVVLDSVFPPEINGVSEAPYTRYWTIEQIAANCAADADCSNNIGDIKALIENGIERLSAEPVPTPAGNFTAEAYVSILGQLMTQPKLASWISKIDGGTDEEILAVLQQASQHLRNPKKEASLPNMYPKISPFYASSLGMFSAVLCGEEKPYPSITAGPNIAADFRESTQSVVDQLQKQDNVNSLCNIFIVPARGEIETQPVLSNIPTLVLADTNDSQTPPAWSMLTADTLDNSQYAEFEGFGHGLLSKDECINQITLAFLNNPDSTADQTCINSLPKVDYVTE
jgi:pimeloyl-ACP methyl ester carboxylesterase